MLSEVENVRVLHPYAWMANPQSRTHTGVFFAESKMAAALGQEILLLDINGGVKGAVEGLEIALKEFEADLLVGLDVGGDSLAQGGEPGLRSPLADAIMLAAFTAMEQRGHATLWGVFGYGSDGELTTSEIQRALARVAEAGGLLGAWAMTPPVVSELEDVVEKVPTEASAIPLRCARGAWGEGSIRYDERKVRLTPLTTLTFYLSASVLFHTLSRPAQAVAASTSLEEANDALHRLGIKSELDLERERAQEKELPGRKQ